MKPCCLKQVDCPADLTTLVHGKRMGGAAGWARRCLGGTRGAEWVAILDVGDSYGDASAGTRVSKLHLETARRPPRSKCGFLGHSQSKSQNFMLLLLQTPLA